jgi:hypothetical protein
MTSSSTDPPVARRTNDEDTGRGIGSLPKAKNDGEKESSDDHIYEYQPIYISTRTEVGSDPQRFIRYIHRSSSSSGCNEIHHRSQWHDCPSIGRLSSTTGRSGTSSTCLPLVGFLPLLFLLLFRTTKSVSSFTCLPQTTVLKQSPTTYDYLFVDRNVRHHHQRRLLSQQHSTQPQYVPHSNTNSLMMTSYPHGSESLPMKRMIHFRWEVPITKKFTRNEVSSTGFPLYSTSPSASSSSSSMNSNTSNNNSRLVTAVVDNNEDQIEAIQMIFTNYCDADGLMTKMDVMKVPYIADLLVGCVL